MVRLSLVVTALVLTACGTSTPAAKGPTWYKDVQPLVTEHCGGCHVEGGIGPFALSTVEQARAMSGSIVDAISTGRMPPWMPKQDCAELREQRRLTQEQIDTITSWANTGMEAGNAKDAQALKEPVKLPWVDMTIKMQEEYTPSNAMHDDYRCFPLDPKLTGNQDVIGFEVTPGTRKQVHHVLFYSVPKADADRLDAAEPGSGWSSISVPGK